MQRVETYVGMRVMDVVVGGTRNREKPRRWIDSGRGDLKEKQWRGNNICDGRDLP